MSAALARSTKNATFDLMSAQLRLTRPSLDEIRSDETSATHKRVTPAIRSLSDIIEAPQAVDELHLREIRHFLAVANLPTDGVAGWRLRRRLGEYVKAHRQRRAALAQFDEVDQRYDDRFARVELHLPDLFNDLAVRETSVLQAFAAAHEAYTVAIDVHSATLGDDAPLIQGRIGKSNVSGHAELAKDSISLAARGFDSKATDTLTIWHVEEVDAMTMGALRSELAARKLSDKGAKAVLISRLFESIAQDVPAQNKSH
ncbi:uncharacterized protein L969DRAFT_92494 [Mixia osmundae IAM 14324]|uniref:SAP domain-containing protein n=1 Tax=Mixia osmundae (strain CBS 9802 / IAM 14324 / JCM 22182 / KY 12970) TaxID=764103 RepID=G7DXD6_MIXOS|nr:uncharacterized protein L969DRAFT_92494 [Mixia osmundae IAM 14324]KEI41260.1 hypothetical protein L969DRAFT_92494 [Mixia osmundae IAM 14324]GAA95246.1 hypothetical protein E5Q_01902 [Mixia osmundae IAM 14324]